MIWIFAYGSLMWRPGFEFRARRPAFLRGYNRAFCRLSFRHRGTPGKPGMVMGLTPGGVCRGVAYGVPARQKERVLAYLDQREGAGYRRVVLPVEINAEAENGSRLETHEAWTYLPEPSHPTHAPHLPEERIVELIAGGAGQSGTARDYLRELMDELARLNVEEPRLQAILTKVEAARGTPGAGNGRKG